MADTDCCHDQLTLPIIPEHRRDKDRLEVWHDPIEGDRPAFVVLAIDDATEGMIFYDLLPVEARALAHLLFCAAEHQERRRDAAEVEKSSKPR